MTDFHLGAFVVVAVPVYLRTRTTMRLNANMPKIQPPPTCPPSARGRRQDTAEQQVWVEAAQRQVDYARLFVTETRQHQT